MSRVPRIRFKGFEEDWEQRKLGEIVREVTRVDENSKAPVMMITANDGFIEQSERYSTDNAGKSLKKYILLKKWELAYNHGASKIRPFGSCFALTRATNIRIPFVYHCFLALEDNPEFLEQTLNGKNVENQLRKIVSSGARMDGLLNISFQEYTSIFIRCPIRKEQDKIAILIKSIDHLITLHQRKLEKLKIIKKSMLENLFPKNGVKTPKIRFLGFTKDWEQRKLRDFGKATGGISIESEFDEYGKYKVISIGSYSEESKYTDQGIRVYKTKKTESRILNKNDLVMILNDKTSSGNIIGRVLLIDKDNTYVYNQRTERIEINKSKFLPEYLYQLLNSDNIRIKIIYASQGNTQIYVNWTVIREFTYIITTDIEEQGKIARFFITLDHLITLHQSKLEKLQKIKKSMLESMFI